MAKRKMSNGKADRYKRMLEKVQGMDLGGGMFWKPGEGRSTIRILPPVKDMEFFFKEVGRHYISNKSYYCPDMSTDGDEKCPCCEVNELLYQAGEKDAAKTFRASRQFFLNVIVRGEEAAGPRIYTPGIQVFSNIVALAQDPDYGEIYDIDAGTDLNIDRSGTGLDTEYTVTPKRNESALGTDEEVDQWLEDATDLDAWVAEQLLDYDDIAEKTGADAYLYEDEEEESAPRVSKKTMKQLEEEEEVPWEDEEDESPSEAIQKRLERRGSRRPARRSGR